MNVAPIVDVNGKKLPSWSNVSFASYGFSPVLLHRQTNWPAFLSLSFLASLTAFFSLFFISDYILSNLLSGNIVVLWPAGGIPQEADTRETFEHFPWPSLKQDI